MQIQVRRAARRVSSSRAVIAWAFVITMAGLSAAAARAAPTPNERYVNLAYSDLLARTPVPGELSAYASGLDNNTLTRPAFVSSLVGSAEYNDDKTSAFYGLLLHRTASAAERSPFVTLLQGGGTFELVEGTLAGSAEYFTNRAGSTNDGFLDALYADLLARAVQPAERAAYDGALTSGTTRQQLANSILTSSEYRTDAVSRDYGLFLHRDPAPTETSNLVASALDERQVVKLLVGSNEYYALAQTVPEPATTLSGLLLLLSPCLRRHKRAHHRRAG